MILVGGKNFLSLECYVWKEGIEEDCIWFVFIFIKDFLMDIRIFLMDLRL